MSNEKIDNRLISLIEYKMNSNKRFKELEEKTGIAANRWQSVWHGRQRAMPDMIEIICRIFPEYAFWLTTGITDSDHGHISPTTDPVQDIRIPLSDEKLKLRHFTKKRLRTAARDYFIVKLKIKDLPNWADANDDKERCRLQFELLDLLRELDVLEEIRVQQERTLTKLEEEAIRKMTGENGFDDAARTVAQKRIDNERQLDMKSSGYTPPEYPDLPI